MSVDTFNQEKVLDTLRPAALPDNRKLFFYPLIVEGATALVGAFLGNNIIVFLALAVLAVFPGLPLFFHLVYHFFVKIELHSDKLVITDYIGDRLVKSKIRQEICFSDIWYIYYLSKEINLLLRFRSKLKKFKISPKETNYTKDNLMGQYAIPEKVYETFEKSLCKALTDYTGTDVLMKLDDLYGKYNISKNVQKDIQRRLKNDNNFNMEYLKTTLGQYKIISEDLDDLNDELSNINTDILKPFLLTKVNLPKYQRAERGRYGAIATVKTDIGLVLANSDGTQKAYFMRFHDLSEKDWHRFIEVINIKNSNIKYLMTKREHKNLLNKLYV